MSLPDCGRGWGNSSRIKLAVVAGMNYTEPYSFRLNTFPLVPGSTAMHRMLSPSWLGHRSLPASCAAGRTPYVTLLVGLLVIAAMPLPQRAGAAERDVMSHTELSQIGLVQAWRRHLSVPAGTDSIIDHKLYVHQASPKQYIEVLGKAAAADAEKAKEPTVAKQSDATDPAAASDTAVATKTAPEKAAKKAAGADDPATAASAAAARPVYARYLLEIPDVPPVDKSLASKTPPTSKTSTSTPSTLVLPDTSMKSMLERMTMSGKASFASSGLLDRAEAERRARNDIRRLKRRGIDAEIQFREVPTIRMYTLANDGTIESRDAETGELVWLQRVGDRVKGYSGFGVDDHYLTIVNGSELIKLDTNSGGLYGVQELRHIPTRGPQHCGNYAVVPSVGDRMVAYPLSNEDLDTLTETVNGDALALPTPAVGSVKLAWGTSEAFVFVLEVSEEPVMDFRLTTDGNVNGKLAAASGERFYFGSASGQIYGLRATRKGDVMWTRPTGDPIHEAPVVFDDRVLFYSTDGDLICVDAATGVDRWGRAATGVEFVIGVIGDRIYVRTLSGTMAVLNTENGETIEQLPGVRPRIWETNVASDRLYLLDKHGSIQCLRRPEAEMPTLTVTTDVIPAEDESKKEDKKSKAPAEEAPDASDPFGGGADPFGGGADPFGGGADPFGGGADPFGGGGDDPFGG